MYGDCWLVDLKPWKCKFSLMKTIKNIRCLKQTWWSAQRILWLTVHTYLSLPTHELYSFSVWLVVPGNSEVVYVVNGAILWQECDQSFVNKFMITWRTEQNIHWPNTITISNVEYIFNRIALFATAQLPGTITQSQGVNQLIVFDDTQTGYTIPWT